MRVAVYIGYHGSDTGGIFTYTIALLRILSESTEVSSILLIYSPDQINEAKAIAQQYNKIELIETRIKSRFTTKHLWNLSMALLTFKNVSEQIPPFVEKAAQFLNPYNYFINRIKCDIVHVPFQFSPFYKVNKPIVISLHDVQEYHFPEFFSSQTRIDRTIRYKMAIDYTNIIVSFKHVKDDLIKYFGIKDRDKICICPILGNHWVMNTKAAKIELIRDKYNIKERYLLYPAQTWIHKNHINLLKALKLLKDEGLKIKLYCTGTITEYYQEIKKEIEKLELTEDVNFLGLVSSDELNCLYLNAHLVVIPTLYEAGSGPLFEAIRFNTPVICSNVTSLPDTIHNRIFVFNPIDINEMAEKIKLGFTDNNFREKNRLNSKKRMDEISSMNFSVPFLEAYKSFIRSYKGEAV